MKKMKTKEKKLWYSRMLYFLLFMVMAGGCGYFGGMAVRNMLAGEVELSSVLFMIAIVFLGMYVAILLQMIFHEAGHLIFGLISGYKFCSFRIGSLMWVKKEEGIRRKRYSLMGTGGQCLMAPPDLVDNKVPYVLYNMGGVLMNLIMAGISVVLYFLCKDISILALLLVMQSIAGVVSAIMNGIPMHLGAVNNDGYNVWSLGRNPEAMYSFWMQLKINAMITDGIRLKDMPEEWFKMPSDEELKNGMCAVAGVFACCRAMDQMDLETASRMIYELLTKETGITGVHKGMLTSELMYCELVGKNRLEVLNEFDTKDFHKFCKAMSANPSLLRMQYARELLAHHDETAAKKKLETFEKVAKTYPHQSEIESERELLVYAQQIYQDTALK